MERFRGLSQPSRIVFWLILTTLVAGMLYAVFSTQLGQTALLICCGGGALVIVIGLASERGMRRGR
jgi:hypothetical protein